MNKIDRNFENDYVEISIMLKSQMLCDVLKKYENVLTANMEITIKDDVFTYRNNQSYCELPYLPFLVVHCLLTSIQVWEDCSYISVADSESLAKELSDNALELSNSVYEMVWINTYRDYYGHEQYVESAVIKDCHFSFKGNDMNINNTWNSDGLSGIRKTVYEYVAKNNLFEPQTDYVLYRTYAVFNSGRSEYCGEQFKNAMLKVTQEELTTILDSLVKDGYLAMKSDGIRMGYCTPNRAEGKWTMTIKEDGVVVEKREF